MVARDGAEGPAVGKEPSPKPVLLAATSYPLRPWRPSPDGRVGLADKEQRCWGHLNRLGVRSEAAPVLSSGRWAGKRSRRLWLPPPLSTGLLSMVVLGSELVWFGFPGDRIHVEAVKLLTACAGSHRASFLRGGTHQGSDRTDRDAGTGTTGHGPGGPSWKPGTAEEWDGLAAR